MYLVTIVMIANQINASFSTILSYFGGAYIHFSDWGGGGAKVRKISTFSARRKLENYVCLVVFLCKNQMVFVVPYTMIFKPILVLHMNFSSCRNYWGGGGKTICLLPQYFHWGGGGATAPQDRRLCYFSKRKQVTS